MESSELWQSSFSDEGSNPDISRLATSLRGIRRNAEQLTSRIATSLPDLTLHDISHLDALWDVASIVAGPEFQLNPLEAYVFGASVLLHDAGLCFEAYSGGRDAIRASLQWRDAFGRLASNPTGGQDLELEADFEAVRKLHALQAERLAVEPWTTSDHEQLHIIEDRELRESYGRLIGEIASSHHWHLDQVLARFSTVRPPPGFIGANWGLDSLKIACLLRVADAGHMDSTRAPSLLLKVLDMNSVSRAHWTAQNHLGRLTVNPDDPEQLTIGSMSPFSRKEARAWWVAFDLVAQFDKELRGCNEILKTAAGGPRPLFARKRVAGAGRVGELAKHIETMGWKPTDSTVHVSDVAALVAKLGGEQLYGSDCDRLNVALRELVQNAADAISARRSIANGRFAGRVTVRLARRQGRGFVLQVDDDGVGMTEETLSNDLLDFGKSFWAGERASREFPGIHASGFSPAGRFGIGFFSIFMAAQKAHVFSRRFDKGLADVRCLSFESGLTLRPTLSGDRPSDFDGMDVCTRVELDLKPGVVVDPEQIQIRCGVQGYEDFSVTFEDYVAAMVAGVNVPVFVESDAGHARVHKGFPPAFEDRENWIESLSYIAAGANAKATVGLTKAVARLRPMHDGDKTYGFAAIDVLGRTGAPFRSAKSVGGLVQPHGRFDDGFVGLIDHFPANARRDAGEIIAPRRCVAAWLADQLALLKNDGMSILESLYASYSVCQLGHDPKDFLQGILVTCEDEVEVWPIDSIGSRLKSGLRLGFPVSAEARHLDVYAGLVKRPEIQICIVVSNGKLNEATLSHGVPEEANSLVGIVHRVLKASAEDPKWSTHKGVSRSLLGSVDILEVTL